MKILDNKIELEEKDYKNKYRKIKKYRDKDYIIISKGKNDEEKAFIKAFNEKNIKKRYELIYDYMCEYLDNNVCKLCDFKNDRCKANRKGVSVHDINGCCYFRNEGFCKLFKDKKCTNPNISCKLFMCSLIEKEMGFTSVPKNYLMLNYFFNYRQKELLRRNYRRKKEETIEKLLKKI